MVDTDDTRRTTDDGRRTTDAGRRTTPRVWHKLPTGELKTEKTNKRGSGPKARGRGRNAALEAMKERKALVKKQREEKMNVCNQLIIPVA